MQLASGQHRLQEVSSVHAALGLTCADDGVQLINKEDDTALGLAYLLQNGFQTLLKFAPVLGACNKSAHVQGEYGLVLQTFRYVSPDYTLGQTFGYGGLAHAGFAYEHRVVLGLTGEDADDVPYLRITSYHRVQLVLSGPLHQIGAVFGQSVIGVLRVVPGDGGGLHLAQLCGKSGLADAVVGKDALDGRGGGGKNTYHHMFHGEVFVSHGLGCLLGSVHYPACLLRQVHLSIAAHLGQGGNGGVQLGEQGVAVYAHAGEQGGD